MDVTVRMTEEDFLEFTQWRKEKRFYAIDLERLASKYRHLVKKITFALIRDEKKSKKVKILDQEHALECLEWAEELLEQVEGEKRRKYQKRSPIGQRLMRKHRGLLLKRLRMS